MNYLRIIFFLLFYGLPTFVSAQLPEFTLYIVATDETCTSNGKLEMSVSGNTPYAEMSYHLYLAPDFEVEIAATLTSAFSSLPSGNYRIIATQILNGVVNYQQKDVFIKNLIETLDYKMVNLTEANCDLTATLKVELLNGKATSYEIISGPVVRGLQSSDEFSNLPAGTYLFRVYDSCNDALAKSFTFVIGANNINIGDVELPEIYLSCNSIEIKNIISGNGNAPVLYPLQIKYTVYDSSGIVLQEYTQNITSGPTTELILLQNIAISGSQNVTLKVQITDNCSIVFGREFVVDPNPKVSVKQRKAKCGELFFDLVVKNYFPPYTLNFTKPASFNFTVYNAQYPGPYQNATTTFGATQNTIPFGDYTVSLKDNCGRVSTVDYRLVEIVS